MKRKKFNRIDGSVKFVVNIFIAATIIWALNVMATQVWHVDIKPLPANGSDVAP